MPSILNVSGYPRTARPNIYTKVDASALAGGAVTSGNIAIVGDFSTFPSSQPVLFSSRRAFVSYDPKNSHTELLAQLAFNPSADPNANLGASSVRVVNTRSSCTQAELDLGAVTLKSKLYGLRGNVVRASVTEANDVFSVILDRGGVSESYTIKGGSVATFSNNTGGDITIECIDGVFAILDASSNTLLTLTENETKDLRAVVSQVNQLNGLSATLIEASTISLAQMDSFSISISDGQTEEVTADNHAIFKALELSSIVEVEINNSINEIGSNPTAGTFYASGGSEGGTLEVQEALSSIENENIQIVVLMDFTEGNQTLLTSHLDQSAKAGYERQAYVAIEHTSDLTAVKNRAKLLNRADIALASQSIVLYNSRGLKVEKDARYTALLLAGMQAGSDIGEPLTRKRPSVLSTKQNYNTHYDAEEALQSGTVFISEGATGLRIERGITTWLEDSNPIFSEISAYESILASLRDMRVALQDQIGRPTKSSQMSLIEGRVTARLSQQVRDGLIKAFASISLEDAGDAVLVSYDVAPLEPLNFITLTAIAQRIN